MNWNWNRRGPNETGGMVGGLPMGNFDSRISGTFRLNVAQSDDVRQVIDRSTGVYDNAQGTRMRANLERRLGSPENLVIEKSGRRMTFGSNLAPQVTFELDGVARTETNARGRTIRTMATSTRDSVTISYEGDRSNDFYVTLTPLRNNQLRVTRRIYLENRNEQVTVTSVYDRVDNYTRGPVGGPVGVGNVPSGPYRDFVIPNGTRLTAVLNDRVDTNVSQVGDRFTMEVTSPGQFNGAVIEGRLAQVERSGRVSGRANVGFEFDTIRLRNGQSYRFAGIIDSVRLANGDNVSVNNEGAVRDGS
ncbi:MAG: hypothetical protein LC730_06885, partial [Acidobacteria bacterium]|nr:hypothetical protein [Acidobacteriota bacterium]